MYLKNLLYILEHKKNVFKACWKRKLYLHAFMHDISKLRPSEFIPYAKWFYGDSGVQMKNLIEAAGQEYSEKNLILMAMSNEKTKANFEHALDDHYRKNKHHWNHWYNKESNTCKDMPRKYIMQMICDWEAMSYKFGGTPQEFYINNYDNIKLSLNSRLLLDYELNLIDDVCLVSNVTLKDYCKKKNLKLSDVLT